MNVLVYIDEEMHMARSLLVRVTLVSFVLPCFTCSDQVGLLG